MKKFSSFLVIFVTAIFFGVFSSCSGSSDDSNNDEQNDNPQEVVVDVNRVFTGGMPQKANGIQSISYNSNGLVTEMQGEDGEKVTFEYSNVVTRSLDNVPRVRMTVYSSKDEYEILDMKLNKLGFVEKVVEQSYNLDGLRGNDSWNFKYNSDDQMEYMKRTEGGNEETFITYKDGNIVNVKMTSEEVDNKHDYKIYYTSTDIVEPYVNKGCVMLFDATFGIDLDEMKYAYCAGLLGKSTSNLPVGMYDGEKQVKYNWQFNSIGYPTKVITEDGSIIFQW